jgi:hypothetical protein
MRQDMMQKSGHFPACHLLIFLRRQTMLGFKKFSEDRNRVICSIGFSLAVVFMFALTFGLVNATGDDFVCGDTNGDKQINIADVVYIINYIFKYGPAPVPAEVADVNYDGNVNVGDAVYLIGYIFKGGPEPNCPPIGISVNFTGCKTFLKGTDYDGTPPDQDCIEYQYDGDSVLQINHINAGFNCCPGIILVQIDIEADIITIEEREYYDSLGPCYCLCLFDLDFAINDVEPGEYTIKVIEPYVMEGDESLEFTVDLSSPSEGSYCVSRSHGPWGPASEPMIEVLNSIGCKTFEKGTTTDSVPPDQDCAEYQYDGESVLQINHINVGFNCCPMIAAEITVEDNLITIEESESFDTLGPCFCLCLFDVEYEITNLYPGEYTIRFVELYLEGDDELLEFAVDLSVSPSGRYCVGRDHYPWGY